MKNICSKKKINFIFLFFIFFKFNNKINAIENNFKLGIKLSPSLSFCNTVGKNTKFKSLLGMEAGILFDYLFTYNHALNTGLFYSFKKYDIQIKNSNFKIPISYFNIPLQLKFNTNEYWIDTHFFLFSGLILNIKLIEETPEKLAKEKIFKRIKPMFTIGGGIEYELTLSNTIFFEVGYSTDMINSLQNDIKCDIKKIINHTLFCAIGMRF